MTIETIIAAATPQNAMTQSQFTKARAEADFAEYAHRIGVEADILAAERELQEKRALFVADVHSNPLLGDGADIAARDTLRDVVAGALREYLTVTDARNAAVFKVTHEARTLGLIDQAGDDVTVVTGGPSRGLKVGGRSVAVAASWQLTAERALREAFASVRRTRRAS